MKVLPPKCVLTILTVKIWDPHIPSTKSSILVLRTVLNVVTLRFLVFPKPHSNIIKAGRLVGLADSYAVIVLADSATISLAVNRIAAFRSHCAVIAYKIIGCRGSVGRASDQQLWGHGFESHLGQDFSTCLCPLQHTRSERNYPTLVSAERATPKPHSLKYNGAMFVQTCSKLVGIE